jgi:hypothetical protein
VRSSSSIVGPEYISALSKQSQGLHGLIALDATNTVAFCIEPAIRHDKLSLLHFMGEQNGDHEIFNHCSLE